MKIHDIYDRICGSRRLHIVTRALLDVIFPPRCPFCDCVLYPGHLVCEKCRAKVKPLKEPVCARCGKPLYSERIEYCGDCAKKHHIYRQGKAVYAYEGSVKNSMYRFKYNNRREYADCYAIDAAANWGAWIARLRVDAIVPIPMYGPKKRRRGYNQAEVFARALGREVNVPVDAHLVRRVKNTRPMKELSEHARHENLKNAFQSDTIIVEYNRVLLVDDIYTTGSTMDAVADVLTAAGVQQIYFICISIGEGY
jgi:ComF family protein